MTGLPEKDWFQLGEVASRWNLSEDDLLHYAWQDRLRVAVVFANPARVEWSDIDAVRDITLEDGPIALASAAFKVPNPPGGFDPWSLRPAVLCPNDWWGKPIEGGPWSTDQPKIKQRDLVVVREEVERFETLHRGDHPFEQAAQVEASAEQDASIAGPGTVRHSTKVKRAQPLSAEIKAAMSEAKDPDDAHSVYAVLQRWAEQRKTPFIGFAEGEGCKYMTPAGKVKFFNLASLRRRMSRAAKSR